jgi:hypothetical protein
LGVGDTIEDIRRQSEEKREALLKELDEAEARDRAEFCAEIRAEFLAFLGQDLTGGRRPGDGSDGDAVRAPPSAGP